MDDDVPDLEDFSDEISKLKPKKENDVYIGDYTEQRQDTKAFEIKTQDDQPAFQGLKKGFLASADKPTPNDKKADPDMIKPQQKKKNPLEIDEVQQNMNANPTNATQFLMQSKDKWLNEELLTKVATNPKLLKLFNNPEYMQAIQMMQSKPKEVMQRYQNNPEFVELFTEFSQLMGNHFQNLDEKEKPKQQPTQPVMTKQQQTTSKPSSTKKSHEEHIQEVIQNDPEVRSILQDPKVVAFIEYLQRNGGADFREIFARDPPLGQKIQVLIKKGILNAQS